MLATVTSKLRSFAVRVTRHALPRKRVQVHSRAEQRSELPVGGDTGLAYVSDPSPAEGLQQDYQPVNEANSSVTPSLPHSQENSEENWDSGWPGRDGDLLEGIDISQVTDEDIEAAAQATLNLAFGLESNARQTRTAEDHIKARNRMIAWERSLSQDF